MRHINLAGSNVKETLLSFSKARSPFLMIQKLGLILSFVLVITSLPVASKILDDIDIFFCLGTFQQGLYFYSSLGDGGITATLVLPIRRRN